MEGKVALMSSDNQTFEVDLIVAMESQTIKSLIRLAGDTNTPPYPVITLAKVSGDILAMVIKYCEYHVQAKRSDSDISEEDVQKWDKEFVAVNPDTSKKLLLAAHYLSIKYLYELTCKKLADNIVRFLDEEEIRQKYHIQNDILEEEESSCG